MPLWLQAYTQLKEDDRRRLKVPTINDGAILDDLLQTILDKQDAVSRRNWMLKLPGGKEITIRSLLENIAVYVNKVKEIGDVAVQYDPVHAALPWAGVRLLLLVSSGQPPRLLTDTVIARNQRFTDIWCHDLRR